MLRTESVYTLLTKNDKFVEKEQDAETLRIRDLSSAWIKDQVLLEGLGNCSQSFLPKVCGKGRTRRGLGRQAWNSGPPAKQVINQCWSNGKAAWLDNFLCHFFSVERK